MTVTKQQNGQIGIANASHSLTSYVGNTASSYSYHIGNGLVYNDGNSTTVSNFSGTSQGDTIGVALDLDSSTTTLAFYKNGSLMGTAYSGISGTFFPALSRTSGTGAEYIINFGQRAFVYGNAGTNRPAATFKALCTSNLPTSTIADGSDYFDVALYSGNGTTGQSITGLAFSPDIVWIKERSSSGYPLIFDSVRGAPKALQTRDKTAEYNIAETLTSFDSNGFSVDYDGSSSAIVTNRSSQTYCAWSWDTGTSNASNSSGSITSTVRASQTSGTSIVSYTGTGSAATVGHGLGAAPELIIVKNRDLSKNWIVYHAHIHSSPEEKSINLNENGALYDSAVTFNDTAPTSTVFSVGTGASTNSSGDDHIAYCFAPVAGYSAFGTYTGNGSSDGPFVFTNFRVAFMLTKRIDSTSDWLLYDSTRDPFNAADARLRPNDSGAEATADPRDFLSNGFKIRDTGGNINSSGGTYLYIAFAENPFQANGGLAR